MKITTEILKAMGFQPMAGSGWVLYGLPLHPIDHEPGAFSFNGRRIDSVSSLMSVAHEEWFDMGLNDGISMQ